MPAREGVQRTAGQFGNIGGLYRLIEGLLVLFRPLCHPALMGLAAKAHKVGNGETFRGGVVLG